MPCAPNDWPFRPAAFPKRRPVAGWAATISGWGIITVPLAGTLLGGLAVVIAGVSVEFLGISPPELSEAGQAVGLRILIGLGILIFGALLASPAAPSLIRRGLRLRAESAAEVLGRDKRPAVLFLRSFEDEDIVDPSFRFFMLGRRRYEAALARILGHVGPPISIGRPGEAEPELGAARVYVQSEDWQKAVSHFMETAAIVLIVVGRTEGIWWEIGEAARRVAPQRLLFFFPYVEQQRARQSRWRDLYLFLRGIPTTRRQVPFMAAERQERYSTFREQSAGLFASDLPEALGDSLFLTFSKAGEPQLLPSKRPLSARISQLLLWKAARMQIDLRRTLRPFVKAHEQGAT